jgi:hypothetical protein
MEKGRILIDKNCGRFIEPDAGGYLTSLNDLKQWH